MFVRESLHRTGAVALSRLLSEASPPYQELRSKPILAVVGPVAYQRPYVERQEFSPGVRRMMAVVGRDALSNRGHEQ
jgi:hypothetical protein